MSLQSQILQNSIAKGPGLTKGGLGALGDGGAVGIWMIVILGGGYCLLEDIWRVRDFNDFGGFWMVMEDGKISRVREDASS